MAGKRVETPVTLTNDISKILGSFKDIKLSGECDFITACNIAMLVLKHRQNKNQKQRILMFVASPIKHKNDDLVLLGKKLKKNNIALDIISMGNVDTNREAVNLLVNTVNNSENSHLLEVGVDQFVVDSLFTSPILNDNMDFGGNNEQQPVSNNPGNTNPPAQQQQGGGLSQFERDINLAIQQSMEEEERRRKAEEGGQPQDGQNQGTQADVSKPSENKMEVEEEDDDLAAELEKARLLSIKEHEEIQKKEKEQAMKNELINDDTFMKDLLGEVGIDESMMNDVIKDVKGEENEKLIKEKEKEKEKKEEDDEEKEKLNK